MNEGVRVKPLRWHPHPVDGEQAVAAGLGLYRVHSNGDDWYLNQDHMGKGGKSSAQADCERRILATLDFVTSPGPEVCIKPMRTSDGGCDHFVSIKVGDREVHPHMFREEYKAAYHVALYDWCLNGGEKPDLMAFGPGDFPAQRVAEPAAAHVGATRLYDATAPMADGGERRMTAAEAVLAWLLIETIGVPDDVGYSPQTAREIIGARLKQAENSESAALEGGTETAAQDRYRAELRHRQEVADGMRGSKPVAAADLVIVKGGVQAVMREVANVVQKEMDITREAVRISRERSARRATGALPDNEEALHEDADQQGMV